MTDKTVLSDTVKVLELIEESEEKLSILREEFKQNEKFYNQVIHSLKEIRERKTENLASLNENKHLKSSIKDFNEQFITFAQQLYSNGKELFAAISSQEIEFERVENILGKNEEKHEQRISKYKHQEELLTTKLMSAEEEKIKKTITENGYLEIELDELKKIILEYEDYVKQNTIIYQQEEEWNQEILNLQTCLKLVDDEVITIKSNIRELENYKEKMKSEAADCISELTKKIQDITNEVELATNVFEESKAENESVIEKINALALDKWECDYEKYKRALKDIETMRNENEEIKKNKLITYEKTALEYEEMCKTQEGLNSQLNVDTSSVKVKVKNLIEELTLLTGELENLRPKIALKILKEELVIKQEELKQVKDIRHELKEMYKTKTTDREIETKKLRNDIQNIEIINKKMQDEIDKVEMEIKQFQENKGKKIKEKLMEEEKSKPLDTEIENLKSELEKIKSEIFKKNQNCESKVMAAPKHIPPSKRIDQEKKLKIKQHWDSDSSIEGEDRWFSEMAKQKIRMRNVRGNKS